MPILKSGFNVGSRDDMLVKFLKQLPGQVVTAPSKTSFKLLRNWDLRRVILHMHGSF